MMKRIVLIFVWISGLCGMVSAQVETNTQILRQAAIDYKIAGDINYAKALLLAKQKGWPLTFNSKRGNRAILTGVDAMGFPSYTVTFSNAIAAATTRANQLWPGGSSGLNLSGNSSNMKDKLGIWDESAILKTHVELTGRITQKDNPSSIGDHSTHVTGTLMASGVNPSAKGMAFGLQGIIAYDFQNFQAEMFTESSSLLVSNHSYGAIAGWSQNSDQGDRWEFWGQPDATEDYKFGFYTDVSMTLDSIAYFAPNYLIVTSAGNNRTETGPAVGSPYFRFNASGQMVAAGNRPAGISSNDLYDCIPAYNGAKNVLTVGAVSGIPLGYNKKEDVIMSSFSSWGPTDDGRIKPDIVADGISVLSPISTSNTSYASFGGTSMSSPNAAGSLFLLQEYYSKLKGSTSFLRSATIKGLAIHTADEAGTANGPDYQFGWGLLNVEKAAAVITAAVPSNNAATSTHQLYENTLTQGQTFTTTVIASGKQPLSATISWTDVRGTVDATNPINSRAKKLVNDLDIRITTGSGASLRTYFPWTLDVNVPGAAAVPGDNTIDNVERINVTDSTIPGQTYTVTVTHKGTLARGSQAYSLLISGVGGTAYCTSASGGGGARIDSVSFSTIQKANSAGSKTYTNNTNLIGNIESSQTLPLFIKLGNADASTNFRIVKAFIDYNNNGVFDVATELAGTSPTLSSTATSTTLTITTAGGLTVGNISLLRIIVQETITASDINPCGSYGKGETQDYRVRVVNPSVDMAISEIVTPASTECSNVAQYVTVKIRNNGVLDQKNIPVTLAVSTGGTAVLNLSTLYPGTVTSLASVNYTFQTPFVSNAGTTYSITATVNLSNDQFAGNNQLVAAIATGAKPSAISASGEICTTSALLRVNNADASNYFWYATPTGGSPFAVGSTATTTTIPSDKTYYVAKESRGSIGYLNKLAFTSGGYNNFNGNYVKFNNTVPILIETARFYIGNPGRIKITAGDLISETSTGYTYRPFATNTIDAYQTNPIQAKGGLGGNPTNDSGAIYSLNLPVTTIGDHIIIVECIPAPERSDSASIFRNNGITGSTTYPIGIPNIVSITGNSVKADATNPNVTESQFYYFFYDMRINTGNCVSDRISVVASTAPTPVVTKSGDSLLSTIAGQWFLNDTAITAAANTNHFKPTKPGNYKVTVTDIFGCQKTSNIIAFTVTAIPELQAAEIKLKVSPNPNNGVFNLSFEVSSKADLSIEILSSSGQKVFNNTYPNFTGKFSKQIRAEQLSSAFYILQIQHNKKTYLQKILIQR